MDCNTENGSKKGNEKKIILIVIIIVFILIIPFITKVVADRYATAKINKALEAVKGHCYAIYDSAGYDLFSKSLHVKDLSIICMQEEAAKFGSINFSNIKSNFSNHMPVQMNIDFKNAVINTDAKIFGKVGEIAYKTGLTSINYRGKIFYSLATASDNMSFTINADNIGVIVGEINIKNSKPLDKNIIKTVNQLLNTNGTSMNITFKDNGFIDLAMNKYAETIGTNDPLRAISRSLAGLENRIRNKAKTAPETSAKLEEIYKFIQNPNEINISAKMEDNISLRNMYSSLNYSGWKSFINSIENFKPLIKTK